MPTARSLLPILLAVLAAAGSARAQATNPETPETRRAQLIREGARLVRSIGRVERDPDANRLQFVANAERAGEPAHELLLAPCRVREEIERVLDLAGDDLQFEMTGIVYVFRGHNYLLPLSAPPLEAARTAPPPVADSGSADPASSIERALERRVGAVPRSADVGDADALPEALVPDQTRIVSRRGHVVRNPRTGNWRMIFDADAQGTADPPMDLLPCLLLERIEKHARFSDGPAAALLSGQVHVYRGRNFLLPTVFRIPRDAVNIQP